jgi:protein TonB
VASELPVLEFSRLSVDTKGVRHEKVIKRQEVRQKVEKVKPLSSQSTIEPVRRESKVVVPPPQGARNKVEVAKSSTPSVTSQSFTSPPDGKAAVGVPTDGQKAGQAIVNPDGPTSPIGPITPPTKPPDPSPPAAPPAQPPIVDPQPPAPSPPKPKGPTLDAEPTHQVDVEIPDSLKSESFKSHVHVKVTVGRDGSFDVTLRTSSGNLEVDKLVLECLKKWKWKPALKEGEPVESVHLFLFEFEVK